MFVGTVMRRCLIPAAAVVAEAKLTHAKAGQNQENSNTCRPSDLPIYTPDPPMTRTQIAEQQDQAPNFIQNSVRSVRQTVGKYYDEFYAYEKVAKQGLSDSKQNVEWLVDYLRQEDNTLPKAGAIGIGALTGFIFGLRGGFFKRTLYATTGALGLAAVCYPKEASEYTQLAAVEGKKYLTIAYNFVYGDESGALKVQEVKTTPSVSTNDPHFTTENPGNLVNEVPYPGSLEYPDTQSGKPESKSF